MLAKVQSLLFWDGNRQTPVNTKFEELSPPPMGERVKPQDYSLYFF